MHERARNAYKDVPRKLEWKRLLGVHKRGQGNIEIRKSLYIIIHLFVNNKVKLMLTYKYHKMIVSNDWE